MARTIASRSDVDVGSQPSTVGRAAAVVTAAGFAAWAAFQLLLALGAPLGEASWGGTHDVLPTNLRIASAFAVVFYVAAAAVVLRRGGFAVSWVPASVARWGTWILAVVLTLSALANLASQSESERLFNAPFAIALAVACVIVARQPEPSASPPGRRVDPR